MKKIVTVALLLYAVWMPGQAVAQLAACSIEASINNQDSTMTTDPNGTNVRSGPGTDFKVTKTLHDSKGLRFTIDGSQGSWVRIHGYNSASESGRGDSSLIGWVYAPSLFLRMGSEGDNPDAVIYSLFLLPNSKSRKLANGKYNEVVALLGCKGRWAKVSNGSASGWLSPGTQCSDLWGGCDR